MSCQSVGISLRDGFERGQEPAYRAHTSLVALISHDIRPLQSPEFLDMVAEMPGSRALVVGGQNHLPPSTTIAAR